MREKQPMAGKRPPFDINNLCITVFYLVPSSRVREELPEPLKIIEVLPGMTIGGVYAARYAKAGGACAGEFGMFESFAEHEGRKGFFMPRVMKDCGTSGGSVADAHIVWRVEGSRVTVSIMSGGRALATLKMRPLIGSLTVNASFPFFCTKNGNVVFFQKHYIKKIGISATDLTIPKESPLRDNPFGLKVLSTFWDTANIIIKEPEYVPKRAIKAPELGIPIGKST